MFAAAGSDRTLLQPANLPTGSAGFGSPGADSTVRRIDLNDALIQHPQATYLMRATGMAMRDAGIDDGDVLLVDRALTPAHGQVVVAVVEGELVCRRLYQHGGVVRLDVAGAWPAGAAIASREPLEPHEPHEPLELWGVVTTVIKSLLG
jgi:DNA polymerase V